MAIALSLLVALTGVMSMGCEQSKYMKIKRSDWSEDAIGALNNFMEFCGNTSKTYNPNSYVVTDFDNTATFFDSQRIVSFYSLITLRSAVKPDQLKNLMLHDLPQAYDPSACKGYFSGTMSDLADDICTAYQALWNQYGPFSPDWYQGSYADLVLQLKDNDDWKEYVAKSITMFFIVKDTCNDDASMLWTKNFNAGMTKDDVYNIAVGAFDMFANKNPEEITIESPDKPSKTGQVTSSIVAGFSIPPNTYELWETLKSNGFDIWVVSATSIDIVRAAIDYFSLCDYQPGLLAMCNYLDENGVMGGPVCQMNNGTYGSSIDNCPECFGYHCRGSHDWVKTAHSPNAQPQKEGKVNAILNAIYPEYNNTGPQAGFMDSDGDYWMCTEFSDMKLCVCFNQANYPVNSGGGVIDVAALNQRENLRLSLDKAIRDKDTLYVLQGVDKNIPSYKCSLYTKQYGEDEEKLMLNEDNFNLLRHVRDLRYTTDDVINTFTVKTPADKSLVRGVETGFTDSYGGYHCL